MTVTLRPYQLSAVERVRDLRKRGERRLLLVAPTGSGKTVIAAHIMLGAYAKGARALFLAHRRELLQQTLAKLADAGIPKRDLGLLMGEQTRNTGAPVVVASIATVNRRSYPDAQLVMIDEAHLSLSPTYLAAIEHYHASGATIIGLTATPYLANGSGLGKAYSALEVVAHPDELVAQGFICEPEIYAAKESADLSKVRMSGYDYAQGALGEAMDKPQLVGGIVDNYLRLGGGRRAVAFAASVMHSIHIAKEFRAAGIPAEHLDGETPTPVRDAILARLASGETRVVSNYGCLQEGWDLPSCKCAIIARPTKSLALHLQTAGRVLRPWENVTPIILDHAGNAQRHGFPTDRREFTLDQKPKRGGEAPTKQCPACQAVVAVAVRVCKCGHEWPAPEKEVAAARGSEELVKMTRQQEKEFRWAGPPSNAQLACLRRYSLDTNVSFGEAQKLIAKLARNGWRHAPQ